MVTFNYSIAVPPPVPLNAAALAEGFQIINATAPEANATDAVSFLIEKIILIWKSLYGLFFSYPEINEDFSHQTLRQIYLGLGKEKWRECIDGRYHHLNNKNCFDTGAHGGVVEPGFINSMEKAFKFAEDYLNLKVNADWYLRLHKRTCGHFYRNFNVFIMGQEKVGVFRDSVDELQCVFRPPHYQVSQEGFSEFKALDSALIQEFGDAYGLGEMSAPNREGCVTLIYKVMSQDQVRRVFDKFLGEFYQEIDKAESSDDKLWAIARLHQRLEWLHPVTDGTSRTSMVLMNKFLTDCGFHPAILDYPHVSSSFGLKQWKEYLQAGLLKWEEVRDIHK